MESSVTSQLSSKVYTAELSKLYKADIDAESELFEINIFNSTLHIAPGKSIGDEDGLVYFYVYAIKDEKVLANLGVYELITDEQKLLYDISTFENLLLFDYYYTNPTKIKEFEITGKNNIFDYIKTHLEFEKGKKLLSISNKFLTFLKEQKDILGSKHPYPIYRKIISILSTNLKQSEELETKGIDDKRMDQLKEYATTEEILKITLGILEHFLNVHFLFIKNGSSVSNFRDKFPDQTFTPTQYIIVSTDQTFVSTSSVSEGPQGAEGPEGPEGPDGAEEDQPATLENTGIFGEVSKEDSKETSKEVSRNLSPTRKVSSASAESVAESVAESSVGTASVKSKPKIGPRIPAISKPKLSVVPESKSLPGKSSSGTESKSTTPTVAPSETKSSKPSKVSASASASESKVSSSASASESKAPPSESKASKGIVLGSKRVAPRKTVQYNEEQPPAEDKSVEKSTKETKSSKSSKSSK